MPKNQPTAESWIPIEARQPLEPETINGRVPAIDADGILVTAMLIGGTLHGTSDMELTHWMPVQDPG